MEGGVEAVNIDDESDDDSRGIDEDEEYHSAVELTEDVMLQLKNNELPSSQLIYFFIQRMVKITLTLHLLIGRRTVLELYQKIHISKSYTPIIGHTKMKQI